LLAICAGWWVSLAVYPVGLTEALELVLLLHGKAPDHRLRWCARCDPNAGYCNGGGMEGALVVILIGLILLIVLLVILLL
jgi:hypothetical protein